MQMSLFKELHNVEIGFYFKGSSSNAFLPQKSLNETDRFRHGCPLDKEELGHSTWNLLHTMAAVYPETPTVKQKEDVKELFGILSRNYPCHICAKDLAVE